MVPRHGKPAQWPGCLGRPEAEQAKGGRLTLQSSSSQRSSSMSTAASEVFWWGSSSGHKRCWATAGVCCLVGVAAVSSAMQTSTAASLSLHDMALGDVGGTCCWRAEAARTGVHPQNAGSASPAAAVPVLGIAWGVCWGTAASELCAVPGSLAGAVSCCSLPAPAVWAGSAVPGRELSAA